MIIYPPFIADTVPAFTPEKIVIPFTMNPAVSWGEITGFKVLIKDFQNSKTIFSQSVSKNDKMLENGIEIKITNIIDIQNLYANGVISGTMVEEMYDKIANREQVNFPFPLGQYYKFQMAYDDGSGYFAYSTAAIGRCVSIDSTLVLRDATQEELSPNFVGINRGSFTGVYETSMLSEPLYSYRFLLSDDTGATIQDTGTMLHNVDKDVIQDSKRISTHTFMIKHELELARYYKLQYFVTTINGLKLSTEQMTIVQAGSIPSKFTGKLIITQDAKAKDNGYVNITLEYNEKTRGTFILERSSDQKTWDYITKFDLTYLSDINNYIWRDITVEQGVEYVYSLRQTSENVYSDRILSNPITVEFEDIFLSDGQRQLRIQYNPKVSSFKTTILEQKTDTIGSQYPFFFRNAKVKYKEIPISGLLSYLMDEDGWFYTDIQNPSINLTNENFAQERKFKLEVLDWLNNGEFKLFRSPAEGNYVVRLMNASLSPNDTLGRMLHTFSATGYEVADSDMESLIKNNLLQIPEIVDPEPAKEFRTIGIADLKEGDSYIFEREGIENIVWYSLIPGADAISIDNKPYYNTAGWFTTPQGVEFSKIEIPKVLLQNGDTITLQCKPILDDTVLGIDDFASLITSSEDLLFSSPSTETLSCEDTANDPYWVLNTDTGKSFNIYKTYSLIVRRDPYYIENSDYILTINGNSIDCSDGQVRCYYNLDDNTMFEKEAGLHTDIYARISKREVIENE